MKVYPPKGISFFQPKSPAPFLGPIHQEGIESTTNPTCFLLLNLILLISDECCKLGLCRCSSTCQIDHPTRTAASAFHKASGGCGHPSSKQTHPSNPCPPKRNASYIAPCSCFATTCWGDVISKNMRLKDPWSLPQTSHPHPLRGLSNGFQADVILRKEPPVHHEDLLVDDLEAWKNNA